MSKTIQLATKAGSLHQRYAVAHGVLFSRASYRLLLSTLAGRQAVMYRKATSNLHQLETELGEFIGELHSCEEDEPPLLGGALLRETLIEYAIALRESVATLALICRRLAEDEKGYRAMRDGRASEFNHDKVQYDDRRSHLERIGVKLTKLFSNYQRPASWSER
jgi:hypothetical protein